MGMKVQGSHGFTKFFFAVSHIDPCVSNEASFEWPKLGGLTGPSKRKILEHTIILDPIALIFRYQFRF